MKIDKSAETGLFIAAAIALSIATWPISFTLGAYGEIFYREAFTVWAASLAALVAGGYSWLFQSGERHISWWGAILLLVPSIFVFWVVLGIENDSLIANLLELILLFGSTPYIAYILLSIVVPDAVSLKSKRDMIGLVACFLIVNGASYAIGANNAYFLTCEDFRVAGDSLPEGCWEGATGTGPAL